MSVLSSGPLFLPCVLAAVLITYPAHAAGPLVLIAKDIVQQLIVQFVEDRIADSIRASFGPCKQDLANDAIERSRALTGLLNRGGPPGLGALGAIGNFGGAAQAARAAGAASPGTMPNVGSLAGALGAGAGRAAEIGQTLGRVGEASNQIGNVTGRVNEAASMAGMAGLPGMAGIPGMSGIPGMGAGISTDMSSEMMGRMRDLVGGSTPGGSAPGGIDMQGALAQMQAMMSAPPLSPSELDELAQTLERFGKVGEAVDPSIPACSANDYRRLFARVTVAGADPRAGAMIAPMMGGMLRTMHSSFQKMEQNFAETEQLFGKMSAEDRVEYVETMSAELKRGKPEARRAFIAMMDAGLVRVPEDMRVAMRRQLAE